MAHRLRPADDSDHHALRAIYAATRADELAGTGWSDAQCSAFVAQQFDAQWQHYWQHWPQSVCRLVVDADDGRVLGRLWTDRRPDALHVLDIALLPAARGRGLGSRLLRDLAAEAGAQGLALTIAVEIHNPAMRLYQRLGFQPDGAPQGLHQRMRRPAAALALTDPLETLS